MRFLIALLLMGCSAEPCSNAQCIVDPNHYEADQASVTELVWNTLYGESDKAPGVTWVLYGDCDNGAKFTTPYLNGCVFGDYHLPDDRIWIVEFPGDSYARWKFLSHEYLHAHLYRLYGDADGKHTRTEWKTLLPAAEFWIKTTGY